MSPFLALASTPYSNLFKRHRLDLCLNVYGGVLTALAVAGAVDLVLD